MYDTAKRLIELCGHTPQQAREIGNRSKVAKVAAPSRTISHGRAARSAARTRPGVALTRDESGFRDGLQHFPAEHTRGRRPGNRI